VTAPRTIDHRLQGGWPSELVTVTSVFVRRCIACGSIDHASAFGRRAREGASDWSCPRCFGREVEWLEVVVP
jgi:hypothetical protein